MRRFRLVALLLAIAVLVIWLLIPSAGPTVEPGSILVLDLSGRFIETAEPSILGRLLGDRRRPFVSILSELSKAQRDER